MGYALWPRIKGRVVWIGLTLVVLAFAVLGPRVLGFPHLFLAIVSLPVLAAALVGLPHMVRDPLVRAVVVRAAGAAPGSAGDVLAPAVTMPEFAPTFTLVTGAALTPGNQVDVLMNGDETFAQLWSDLRAAERSITVQMYYVSPGTVADTFSAILAAKARAGVEVYFLYDAFGGVALPRSSVEDLLAAGAHAAAYRPVRWHALDNASHRLHVRGIVIDGRTAYTGGFGLDDKWLGSGRSPGEWRETNVRFTGPAVAQLQAGFVAAWTTATGELLISDSLHPNATPPVLAGEAHAPVLAAVVRSPPLMGSSSAERLLALAIASARRSLYISNPYFVPTPGFVRLLAGAVVRGVEVRILTNGAQSDVKTTWRAGRRSYGRLLRAGARIYEYRPTIHAKTFLVDRVLSAVTTMNFDNRSLAYNSEVALVTLDSTIAARMEARFFEDLAYADEIVLPAFERRPGRARLLEWLASIGSRVL